MIARVIDLSTAAYEIRTAYENRDHGQPFFFVVGAGVSAPSVPLAREITAHCRDRTIASRAIEELPADRTPLDHYSYWFDHAYPQPLDRQRYLRSLIVGKPLPDACLRLAHLVASRRLTNLVVTPNFDDFLERSLAIFGETATISDHPDTVDRIDLASSDLKIVHVHGSHQFYDCRNLRAELEDRARPSARTVRTMAAFLDRAASFSSPVVVGYSGWENDVIMSSLRRRLEGASLPYRLYWFLHRLSALEDLSRRAPWLAEHPDVRFVSSQTDLIAETDTAPTVTSPREPTLTAQVTFEELSRVFRLEEPAITRDPVGFFAKQLRATLLAESGSTALEGLYSFAEVVKRVERAASLEARDFESRGTSSDRAHIETVRRLLRESKYSEAVGYVTASGDKLGTLGRKELFDLLFSAFDEGRLNDADRLSLSEALLAIGDGTQVIKTDAEWETKRRLLELRRGEALFHLDLPAEAILVFDQLGRALTEDHSAEAHWILKYVLTRKSLALADLDRYAEAIALLDSVLATLTSDSRERWLAVQSEFNRATYLRSLKRNEEAIDAFAAFVNRYREATDGWTQVLIASALRTTAALNLEVGKREQGIDALSTIVDLYGHTRHEQVALTAMRALTQRAELFWEEGLLERAHEDLGKAEQLSRVATNSKRELRNIRKLRAKIEGGAKSDIGISQATDVDTTNTAMQRQLDEE
jgi:tetratricopeptide (TPR) repeat protein